MSALLMIIVVSVALIVAAGAIVLQIFLSTRENPILGLILPLIAFLYSLINVLNLSASSLLSFLDLFFLIAATFLLGNIPTLILLAIYFVCRRKLKKKKQLEKMNIQDLH